MSKEITIKDLIEDKVDLVRHDQYNVLVNQNPPSNWLKTNRYANNTKYIPIERIEWLMRKLFKNYKTEVREVSQIFNGVMAIVRVHYIHPVTGEWQYHDGVGASQIQTKKGSSPADLSNINNNAITLCVPIAKAEAFKNACKSFGRIFGSDLNRDGEMTYRQDLTLIEMTPEHPNWDKAVEALQTGNYTVEDVSARYRISEENKLKLEEHALKMNKNG